MNKSETTSAIVGALIKARGSIKPAGKSGKNTFDRYDYATELDWHDAVVPALLAHGLTLSFSITEIINLDDRTTKNGGTEHAVEVHGDVTLLHESGEWLQVGVAGQGQDRADKAIYKAMTGAKKYGYACLFALPTTDDPEKSEPPSAKQPLKKPTRAKKSEQQPEEEVDEEAKAKILSEGLTYIGLINDAAGADAMLEIIRTTTHVGDSKDQLRKALSDRVALIGCQYNVDTGHFEEKP